MASAILEKLDRALGQIDRPGAFCASGSVSAVLPGLEVEGLGPVGLPLTASAAKELIKHCQQAPHGQGEKTVVDTKVRRVWRLKPDHFVLKNPEWSRFIEGIVGKVQEDLGLENQKLESHLYDLLVYEKGGFFLPHRDSEKLDRMVATLVVVLPSPHEGGELVVRHDGQEQTIDFGGPAGDAFHIHYAAFYADCEHEVRPLKKGYRLCLVYNLTLAKSKKRLAAPRDSDHIEAIAPILRKWADDEESTEKLGILLDHQYSREGLTWDALKGTDRVKARVLAESARQAGCRAYLTLVTLHQSGEGEEVGGRSRYGRGRWYDRYDEEEDEGDGEYSMVEIYESELTADHRSDPEGNRLPIGEMEVEEDEILDPEALTGIKPEEEFQGYTGNEGSPLDRWYRHAAIFLWPEARHYEVICSRDSRAMVPELAGMVARWKTATGEEAAGLEAQCRELAAAIVARWPGQLYGGPETEAGESPASRLLQCLASLDAPEMIGEFLGGPLIADTTAEPGKAIAVVGQKYGWPTLRPPLESVMKATTPATVERNVRLLESVCTAAPRKKAGWEELCSALAGELVSAIETNDRDNGPTDWRYRRIDRSEVLAGLARSLIATGQSGLMSRLVDHTLATPKNYPLTEVQIQAIVGLRPWLKKHVKRPFPALTRWLDAVRERLEALTAQEPRKPEDFRREAPFSCKCAECAELKRFLQDPGESTHRFPAREERRRHIQDQIRSQKLDLTARTEERGRPYTLVCTKTTASYEASLKKYHEDQRDLSTMNEIRGDLPG